MKGAILEMMCIIGLLWIVIYFYNEDLVLKKANDELYEKFENNNLLDADGKVNLSAIESKRDGLFKQLDELLKLENFNLDDAQSALKEKENNNHVVMNEIEELSNELASLEEIIDGRSSQYKVLNDKYNKMVQTKKEEEAMRIKASTYLIDNFPTINQYPNYPTGCESVAITLLLNYYGVNVSPNDIINNLKKGSLPYTENGLLYGGNPEVEFVGNPLQNNGYGVYENPIADVALMYKAGINIKSNFLFNDVLNLVKTKRPVMVWTSMNLSLPYISSSWIYKPTGEKISWKANEHAVIVIGYNDNQVIISDPIGGRIKYQSRSVFEARYNYYGKKALYY